MKISEIRNKMFKLSDLKGLINENVDTENINWSSFFSDPNNQKFLGDEYAYTSQSSFWPDNELRTAIAQFPGSQYSFISDDGEITKLNKDARKNIFNAFAKGRAKYIQRRQEIQKPTTGNVNPMSSLSGGQSEQSKLKRLYNFFMENGGSELSYSDELEQDENLMVSYVDKCYLASVSANEHFNYAMSPDPIIKFNDMGLKVGSVKDPFLLFLFFYFFQFCERRGGSWVETGERNKISIYLGNMEPGTISEYVKSVINDIGKNKLKKNWKFLTNVFDLVFLCGKNSLETIHNKLISAGFDGDIFAVARSMAYHQKYESVLSVAIKTDDINAIASTFNYPVHSLFDPLSNISETQITAGLQKCCSNGGGNNITQFIKPVMVQKEEFACPAEQIFMFAKSFKNVLDTDFAKMLGVSGKNVLGGRNEISPEKVELLLGPADVGLFKLEEDAAKRGYSGEKIPQAINGLKELYSSEIKKTEDVRLWRLLNRETETKTQDEIFNYLLGISDNDTVWTQEYNRYEIQDIEQREDGLGRKSIDIVGKKKNENGFERTLCFEYQGEQHYHPINVRPSDYQYALFTAMREDILTKCGFSADEVEDRKYFHGLESIDELSVKSIILDTFRRYASMLSGFLSTDAGSNSSSKILGRDFSLVSEGASVKAVNKQALSKFTIKEAFDYFSDISKKDPNNSGVFENPPLKGMIPYLCSPCRFYDEVQTAIDLERDRIKSSIISKRSLKSGWSMAYITPKVVDSTASSFTHKDFEYTKKLASDPSAVFQWTSDGKKEIAVYLERMGFKTPDMFQESSKSLFQQIIREAISENVQ